MRGAKGQVGALASDDERATMAKGQHKGERPALALIAGATAGAVEGAITYPFECTSPSHPRPGAPPSRPYSPQPAVLKTESQFAHRAGGKVSLISQYTHARGDSWILSVLASRVDSHHQDDLCASWYHGVLFGCWCTRSW